MFEKTGSMREALGNVSPFELGRRFHELLGQVNPATGKKFTMKEGAATMGVKYAMFRNLEALWRPIGRAAEPGKYVVPPSDFAHDRCRFGGDC